MSRLIIAVALLLGACATEEATEQPEPVARGRFCSAVKNDGTERFGGYWGTDKDGNVLDDCCHPTEGGFRCVTCGVTWTCKDLQ